MYILSAPDAHKRRLSQSQLRTLVGLVLLSITLGTQAIWALSVH